MAQLIIFLIIFFSSAAPAFAQVNITISGNGSGSTNTATVDSTNTTTVDQTNTATTTNDVDTSATTGDNTASGNTGGDTSITTGDISSTTTLDTQVNHSDINTDCCDSGSSTVTISDNGSGSTNSVTVTSTNTTSVAIDAEASVTNIATSTANTGTNTANDNNGSVGITTGNITGSQTITTSANTALININCCADPDLAASIMGNGTGSFNTILFDPSSFVIINKQEDLLLVNLATWDANTGGNTANDNLGTVSILTGNINIASFITNGPINDNIICVNDPHCPTPPNPPTPPTPPLPPAPPGGGSNGGSSGGGSSSSDPGTGGDSAAAAAGKVLGAAVGRILPATGLRLYLLSILASLVMLLVGVYLRTCGRKLALA